MGVTKVRSGQVRFTITIKRVRNLRKKCCSRFAILAFWSSILCVSCALLEESVSCGVPNCFHFVYSESSTSFVNLRTPLARIRVLPARRRKHIILWKLGGHAPVYSLRRVDT